MVLVCGIDGVVCLRAQEFLSITEPRPGGVCFGPRLSEQEYHVPHRRKRERAADRKSRGVDELVAEALAQEIQKVAAQ